MTKNVTYVDTKYKKKCMHKKDITRSKKGKDGNPILSAVEYPADTLWLSGELAATAYFIAPRPLRRDRGFVNTKISTILLFIKHDRTSTMFSLGILVCG